MIEKGILALMIICTINAVLIISNFVGDVSDVTPIIPGIPKSLTPFGVNTSDTSPDFVATGIDSTATDLVTAALAAITGFLFNIPLIGDLLKGIFSVGALFFNFFFFWAIALEVSGLPPFLQFVIAIPLAIFQYGMLAFLGFSILSSLVVSRRG